VDVGTSHEGKHGAVTPCRNGRADRRWDLYSAVATYRGKLRRRVLPLLLAGGSSSGAT
jgi:hypothetical protein